MRPKKTYGYYRRPKTAQEKRANGRRSGWSRAKRRYPNLPDSYHDLMSECQKTWKVKRLTQYREKRGQQHTIFLPHNGRWRWLFWASTWGIQRWFDDHDVPCQIKKVERREYTSRNTYLSTLLGYTLTWWSDKDIGIDYVVRRCVQ